MHPWIYLKDFVNRYNVINMKDPSDYADCDERSRGRRIEVDTPMKKWLDNLNKNSMLFI